MALNLRKPWKSLAISLLWLWVVELFVVWQYRGPRPIHDEQLNEQGPQFSAERAISIHEELFPRKPHPAGSVENQLVRDRLVELLRNMGWQVEVQTAVVESDAKVALFNVLARHPATEELEVRPLVLASHYDSVRTGPGAADAGGCVAAVIEAAMTFLQEILKCGQTLRRPLYLLFTDGEELGLLGAQQFVKRHPLSVRKPLVLNFDARGTSGPVLMYQTHSGNRSTIAEWANQLARPRITGSLLSPLFRAMPHGTDFTVFENAGWRGLNFAIIGGAHRYHQPDDTLANLDRRSVQHFGEHVLNLTRAIATTGNDLPETTSDAAYFDVLGIYIVHYPLSWCLPLSLAASILTVGIHRRRLLTKEGVRAFVRIGAASFSVMVATSALGWFLSALLRDVGLLPRNFLWYGPALSLALWCISAAASLGIARWLLRRCSVEAVWSTLWIQWTLAGISVAAIAPEFSHLLLWPAYWSAAVSLSRKSAATKTILVTFGSAVLLVPVQHLFSIAIGPASGALLCPAFSLGLLPLYPALAAPPAGTKPDAANIPTS
jgi:hypothetical protein